MGVHGPLTFLALWQLRQEQRCNFHLPVCRYGLSPPAVFFTRESHKGVSVIWYGFYDNAYPSAAATATYTVDGANPKTITLNGASANPVIWSLPFFTTDTLAAGEHTLQIVYNGDTASTPLSVQALIVNGGALSALVTTPSSSGSSVSSAVPESSSSTTRTTATVPGISSSQPELVNSTAILTLAGGSLTTLTTEITAASVPSISQGGGGLSSGSASPGTSGNRSSADFYRLCL